MSVFVEEKEGRSGLLPRAGDGAMNFLWEGREVFGESVMFVGKEDRAPLLYFPDRVFSVMSADRRILYREGRDYRVVGGSLMLPEGTSIPYITKEEYYPAAPLPGASFRSRLSAHPWLLFGEGDFFHRRQIEVSYSHKEGWERFVPEILREKFIRTLKKLKSGERTTLLFYGDSITEGYNASGFVGAPPYQAPWPSLAASYLSRLFQNDRLFSVNSGLSGKDTAWAIQNLKERVTDYVPDLLVLAFGMNDGTLLPEEQCERTARLIAEIEGSLPDTEIFLVSPMLPNEESACWGHQAEFEEIYADRLLKKHPAVGLVRMTSLHRALLSSKPYYHMTGNNVNHPNDFLSRVYAQAVVWALTGGRP